MVFRLCQIEIAAGTWKVLRERKKESSSINILRSCESTDGPALVTGSESVPHINGLHSLTQFHSRVMNFDMLLFTGLYSKGLVMLWIQML